MKSGKFFAVSAFFGLFGATLAFGGAPKGASCSTAGQADSYVLALSWQPAFCKTVPNKTGKPECDITDPRVYQAQHFTLHGLWPNLTPCGISYGFCGPVKQAAQPFTRYPEVALDPAVRQLLGEVMPSVAAGSGLERHEWYKHGTCSELPADAYFSTAQNLVRQFNASGMSDFMAANIGKVVAVADFFAAIDHSLGAGTSSHVHISCKDDLLVDVLVDLMAPLATGANLGPMLQGVAGKGMSANQCADTFTVQPIGAAI